MASALRACKPKKTPGIRRARPDPGALASSKGMKLLELERSLSAVTLVVRETNLIPFAMP